VLSLAPRNAGHLTVFLEDGIRVFHADDLMIMYEVDLIVLYAGKCDSSGVQFASAWVSSRESLRKRTGASSTLAFVGGGFRGQRVGAEDHRQEHAFGGSRARRRRCILL